MGALIVAGGPWAACASIVALVVVSLVRGWLVPRSTVTLLLTRADEYKSAWERAEQALDRSEEARQVQAQQLDKLLEYARTADAVLRSLPGAPGRVA